MRFDMLRCRVKPRYPGAAECSPEKWGCTSCIQESLLRSATHITASHPEFVALAKTTTSIFLSCATGAERRQRLRRRATSAREMQSAEISWAVVAIVTLCMKHVTVKLNSTWFIYVYFSWVSGHCALNGVRDGRPLQWKELEEQRNLEAELQSELRAAEATLQASWGRTQHQNYGQTDTVNRHVRMGCSENRLPLNPW